MWVCRNKFVPPQTSSLLKCVILVALQCISFDPRIHCQIDLYSQVQNLFVRLMPVLYGDSAFVQKSIV